MRKITLLIGLAFLIGFVGMAQKNISTLYGKAPKADMSTKKNPANVLKHNFSANQIPSKQINTLTTESFEGTFPPTGWSIASPDGGTGWAQAANGTTPLDGWNGGTQDVPTGGGGFVAYCTYTTGGASSNDQWLISPSIAVNATDSLSFYLWFFGAYIDTLDVMISTTGSSPVDFTIQLDQFDTIPLTPMSSWHKFSYSLAPYAGQMIFVGFREHVPDNVNMGAYFALDLFSTGSTQTYPNDISPTALVYPTPADLLTVADTITVMVTNLDTIAHDSIPITCVIDGVIAVQDTITDTIPALSSLNYTFSQTWDFSTFAHVYDVVIYTSFPNDSNLVNDTLNATVYNDYDAASVSIDMLPIIGPGSINPLATVENAGSVEVTFDIVMNIDVYTSVQAVTLAPGAQQQITFDPWTAAVGNYTIEVYTMLSNDMDLTNDTLYQAISVQELKKVYCYVAYDPSSAIPAGPAYTYLQNPATVVSLADQSAQNFIAAGTWGLGNKWYGAVYTDNTLVTIDTVTGARTVIGNTGASISGMAFDYSSNTLYGVDWDGTNSNLFTINTGSGAATHIGTCGTDLLINLACDTLGNLYGASITSDNLYSVNTSTGAVTLIGALGFDAGYAQDMEIDQATNVCYFAAYDATASQGQMMTVDVTTGAATLIGAFAGLAEITGFAIPFTSTAAIIDAGVSAITTPNNDSSCELTATETITVTISNYGNEPISGYTASYKVNSGTPVTESVSGTLLGFASATHTFTTTQDLSAFGSYNIKAWTTLAGDINNANDTTTKTVSSADAVITVNIQTDNYGSETTWELINETTSQVVATGGPYTSVTGGEYLTTNVCGLSTDCYTFNIYDSYGDGLCCTYGNGTYEVIFDTLSYGVINGDFTTSATLTDICATSGIEEIDANANFSIYPNPAKDVMNVSSTQNITNIRITNAFGQLIYNFAAEGNNAVINTSSLSDGVYYLQVETEAGISTKKFNVIR